MLNHSCATSLSAFCEVRYPAKHLFRPARAGSSTAHFAIAPLKLGACASQAEATLSFSRQTPLGPHTGSVQVDELPLPLPTWLQEAASLHIPFKPPTSNRDSSTAAHRHRNYSNKDLDKLICSISHDPVISGRLLVLHRWLLDIDHAFDSRLCTTLISSFMRMGQPAAALNIFFWMVEEAKKGRKELTPTVHTYTAAIQAATAARTFTQASMIWKHAQSARIRGDEQLTCTYMAALFQASYYSQALQLFDSLHNRQSAPPAQAYVLAIRAHTKMGNARAALDLWDEMQQRLKQEITGHGYSAAISACAHARESELAHKIFIKMTRSGIQPDCVSCTSLMHAYASTGAWRAAEALLEKMKQSGVQPRAQTYTGLMGAYGASGELGRALALWRAMRSPEWRGPAADAHVLAVLVKAVGRGDASGGASAEVAEALFSEATADMPAAIQASASLPRAAVSGPAEALMAKTWSQWTEEGFHAVEAFLGITLDAGPVVNGAMQGAEEISISNSAAFGGVKGRPGAKWAWSSAQSHAERASTPAADAASAQAAVAAEAQQARTGNASTGPQLDPLVSVEGAAAAAAGDSARAAEQACEERIDAEAAEQVVRDLTGRGLPTGRRQESCSVVNDAVCVALMMTYSRAGRWRECTAVIGRSQELGIAPTSRMFNVAMYAAACAKQPHVAEALFDSISGESWRVSWETLVFAYSRCAMHAEAEAAIAHMQASNIPLRDYVAVALIQAYSEAGQWRVALRVQRRLRPLGIKPTVHVLNALLTVCVRYHVYDRGVKLLREFRIRDSPNRTKVTELLARAVCQEEVSTIETQQVLATALSGLAAAVGGALIRSGLF